MLRGVRGATTVESNDREEIFSAVAELLQTIVQENDIHKEDIGAAIFSSTPDIPSAFPAAGARAVGWDEVPLFGAQELDVPTGVPCCIRVLLLLNTDLSQKEIKHIYLKNATILRQDLQK